MAYSCCVAAPGWYQDPNGPPGQFRWWDGSVWTERVSDDSSPVEPRPLNRGRLAALVGIGVVVVGLIVGVFAWWQQRDAAIVPPDPLQTSTAHPSGWNELPPGGLPSPTPTPSQTSVTALTECKRSSHYRDAPTKQTTGWLTSGPLSVKAIGGDWMSSTVELPSAYDNASEITLVAPGWSSISTVAQLSKDDGFTDPKASAEYMMDCVARSGFYDGFKSRDDLDSQAVTIDGHPGWHLRANVYVDEPNAPDVDGDVVDVITVDLGASLGVYVSGCTIGDKTVCDQVRKTITTLKVSG